MLYLNVHLIIHQHFSSMSGHGTLISSADAQGEATIWVNDTDGNTEYTTGECSCDNNTGSNLEAGAVVSCEYDGGVCVLAELAAASGTVSADGRTFRITDSGGTGLTGTINISTSHGSNEGWAGENAKASNVNGEAAYLR